MASKQSKYKAAEPPNTLARPEKKSLGARLCKEWKHNKQVYLILIPVVAYFIIFHYIPMLGVQIAFRDYSISGGIWGSRWVGLQHFKDYFNSYYFGRLIKNTVLLSVFNIILSFPASIILALLINEVRNTKFKRIVQTVTYLPHFISIVIVCALLRDFFSSTGLVNQLLGTRIDFFNKEECFRPLYILSGIWQEVGWGSIVYLSAITSIDNSLYEAAEADGANRFDKLIHVTLPGIATTISVMFILRVGRVMTVGADKVLLMYNESIFTTADIISTFVYRQGLLNRNYSYTAAVDLINSLVNCFILVGANKISKKISGSGLW